MQIKVINAGTIEKLETSVNEELAKYTTESILDIKFGVSTYYSAMIIIKG